MIRLAAFIAFLLLAGTLLASLADVPGTLVMDWGGWRMETSVFAALFCLAMIIMTALGMFQFFGNLIRFPEQFRRNRRMEQQNKGLSVLTEAIAAIAVADTASARKLTQRANKLLDHPPIVHLLNAQLARLEGDDAAATQELKPLLNYPETQFLALRALLEQERKFRQWDNAIKYAEDAEALRPDSHYAAVALVDLYTHRQRWQQALAAIKKAAKRKALSKDEAKRYSAIIHYLHAQHLTEHDDWETALPFAKSAYQALPDMVPAANLLVRIYAQQNKKRLIPGIIHNIWQRFPQPETAQLYLKAFDEETPIKRLKRIEKMASFNTDNVESDTAIAGAAMDAGQFEKARQHLKAALARHETAHLCLLMAKLEEAENKIKEAAIWRDRANAAGPDAAWACASCQKALPQWVLHCPECDGFDTVRRHSNRLTFVDAVPTRLKRTN